MNRRTKWKRISHNLTVGVVVLNKDDDTFQRCWPKGKIVKEYPGSDGLVRVVDVMSKGKTYHWRINKLIKLLGEEVLDTSFPKWEDVQVNYLNSIFKLIYFCIVIILSFTLALCFILRSLCTLKAFYPIISIPIVSLWFEPFLSFVNHYQHQICILFIVSNQYRLKLYGC